jgi:NADH:ubiquinone oxidoreductase subunit F (NADH-binding)
VRDIGGGVPGKRKIKAVQTGGPAGGCIPASEVRLAHHPREPHAAGSIMFGRMIVMTTHMPYHVARYIMAFLKDDLVRKVLYCAKARSGCTSASRIYPGQRHARALNQLRISGRNGQGHHHVRPGQSAANPVLST